METTLLVIKPDAVAARHAGEILARVEAAGFTITGLRMLTVARPDAERLYSIHRARDFFSGLVEFITSGPVVAVRLETEDARRRLRTFIGVTDPAQAAPGTIRNDFGTSVRHNAVHASNPDEDVDKELAIMFPSSPA